MVSNQIRLQRLAFKMLTFCKAKGKSPQGILLVGVLIALVAIVDYAVVPNYSLAILYCVPLMLAAVCFDLKGLLLVVLIVTHLRQFFTPCVCPHAVLGTPYTPPHLCAVYLSGMFVRFLMYGMVGLATQALAALYFKERELVARNEALAQEVVQAQHLAGIGQGAALIVHEIKNPLYTMAGAANYIHSLAARLAQEDTLHVEAWRAVEEWAAVTRSEAARLEDLAHLILDYVQGEMLPLQRQPTTLENVLADMQPLLRTAAEQANVTLVWELSPTPLTSLDARRMQQVVLNLFNNALQATCQERVTIKTFHDAANKCVCLSVSDDGCGIPESIRPYLFEPFVSNGKPDGIGLGLAVVKQIVEAHQGQVEVISQAGPGTTFIVALPVSEVVDIQQPKICQAKTTKPLIEGDDHHGKSPTGAKVGI